MRAAAITVENSFVKGLITEASGLNFPEHAVTDTDNCIFDQTGAVSRRLGVEYESDFQAASVSYDDVVISEFLWQSVGKNGEKTFLVVQVGALVSLYEMDTDQTLSAHETYSLDLRTYQISGSEDVKGISASFAAGNGLLFIAHPSCDPLYVERSDGGVFSTHEISLQVRDMTGLDNKDILGELIAIDHRPTDAQFSPNVEYNLKNQGWVAKWWVAHNPVNGPEFPTKDVLDFFHRDLSVYPAESETWFEYKIPQPTLNAAGEPNGAGNSSVFSGLEASTQTLRNTPAPKGHFIYDAFNIDRTTISGVAGIPPETTSLRPSAIAFFAGRVFYAGVNAAGFNTRIYFSQILENNKHIGECYQKQDPTQEDGGDIVASDGGEIVIPDLGKVVHMVQVGSALFVFATNGTWKISGSEGVGFSATDNSITRVSETGAVSNRSFVLVDGIPVWWNLDGIWTIKAQAGNDEVVSLSKTTIASYLEDIPPANIPYVKGAYNPLTRVVQWLFRSNAASTFTENFQYNKLLNFDLNINAFYPWSVSSAHTRKLVGIIRIAGPSTTVADEQVTDNVGNFVTDNDAENVEIEVRTTVETSSRFKYLTVDTENLIVSDEPPGITYDSEFIGSLDDSFSATKDMNNNYQTKLFGGDGLIYIVQTTTAFNDDFVTFDPATGEVSSYTYPEAAEQTAISAEQTSTLTNWNSGHRIIPFPNSKYYYTYMTAFPGGSNTDGVFTLYVINPGGHVRLGSWVFEGNFSYFNDLQFQAVGYYGGQQALTTDDSGEVNGSLGGTDSALLAAVTYDDYCGVVFLPSVATFLAKPDLLGADFLTEADWTGLFDTEVGVDNEALGLFAPVSETSGISTGTVLGPVVFFLPIEYSDGSMGSTVNVMIPKAVFDFYVANSTSTGASWSSSLNTIIQSLGADEYGVIISHDLGRVPAVLTLGGAHTQTLGPLTRTWFKHSTLGAPFGDEGKDRDGGASSSNDGRWMAPSVDYINQTYLLSYVRRYEASSDNLTPTGTYHKVIVYDYDPAEETVAVVGESAAGNTYDVVVDLGLSEAERYSFCPTNVFVFYSATGDTMYIYNHNFSFGTTDRTVISQFGSFVLPSLEVVDLSFSEFNNPSYLDWESVNSGTDYSSYFITGYKLRGQAMKRFQNNYVDLFVNNEGDNTFDFQSRWDFSTANTTGRWSGIQRVNLTSGNFGFKRRRLLLRGTGVASQFSVTSVTGEPFNIIGWATFETGNQNI